jgi:hypothetical protein
VPFLERQPGLIGAKMVKLDRRGQARLGTWYHRREAKRVGPHDWGAIDRETLRSPGKKWQHPIHKIPVELDDNKDG